MASVKSGSFSVKQLPALRASVRASTQDVIAALDADEAIIWDSWGSHNSPNGGAYISKNRFFYGQGNLSANGSYKSWDEIKSAVIANILSDTANIGMNKTEGIGKEIQDLITGGMDNETAVMTVLASKKIITHCQAGNAAAPAYFYAQNILSEATGNNNVVMYDGSWSAWLTYSEYGPLSTQYANGNFLELNTSTYLAGDNATVLFGTYNAGKFWCTEAPAANGTNCAAGKTVGTNLLRNGKNIFTEDYEYLNTRKSANGGSGEATNGGGAGGGC